jgi:hypothetical protein
MATTYTLINKSTLGSSQATVSFTGLGSFSSTYTDLLVKVSARSDSSTTGINIAFNSNTSSYTMIRLYGTGSGSLASDAGGGSSYVSNTMIVDSGYTANTFGNGEIYIPNFSSSNNKSFSVDGVSENNATTALMMFTAGLWSNTDAITSIQLTSNVGNFVSGSSFYLYGIKNS